MTEAFVYCWTDHKTNKLYVGSHKGTADDGYVCSSKYMMEEYRKRPEDFTRQIIAEGRFDDIRKLEEVILKTVNAKEDQLFYNQHNGDGNFYCKGHTTESRQKISFSKRGYEHTEETKSKISLSKIGSQPWNKNKKGVQKSTRKGVARSDSEKKKMSENRKGIQAWNKNILTEDATFYGKTHSEESKKKMSESRKLYWLNKKRTKDVESLL
jgi:hypothetical protein